MEHNNNIKKSRGGKHLTYVDRISALRHNKGPHRKKRVICEDSAFVKCEVPLNRGHEHPVEKNDGGLSKR